MTESRDLREWQKTALDLWKKNDFRGIVEVATAGGKTIFEIEGAKSWLEINPLGKILVIVFHVFPLFCFLFFGHACKFKMNVNNFYKPR